MDRGQTSTKNGGRLLVWSVDVWRRVRGWLVSNAETNSVEQW